MAEDRLLTVEEVAERLRVAPDTVRRFIREGKLTAVSFGGQKTGYRVLASDLEKFIQEHRRRPRGRTESRVPARAAVKAG